MMTKQDYYEILGVSKNASDKEIKTAFKRLARQYHPDVAENKEEAEHKFKEINQAFSILSDREKRQMYDQFGHAGVSGSGAGAGDWPFGGGFSGSGGFGDFDDLFSSFFDMGGGFGGGRRGRGAGSHARRGRDLVRDVEIGLEEAYRGLDYDFDLEMYQTCPICNGRKVKPGAGFKTCEQCQGAGMMRNVQNTVFGQFVTTSTCSRCGGEGRFPEEFCEECKGSGRTISKEKISVKIPAGIEEGMSLRVQEKGEAGENGGPSGDLYVRVRIKEDKRFIRHGKDLYVDLPIGFADAALGAEKELETFEGTEKVKVHAGIQTDTIIDIKGKGMPDIRGGRSGDIKVRVNVVTPTKLTDKQKKLLCEFAEEGPQFHCEHKGFLGKLFDAITGKK